MERSPWWYRHRVATIVAIYWLSFYPAYGLPYLLHRPALPLYAAFGPAHERVMLAIGFVLALAGWALRVWGTAYLREIVWSHNARTDYLYIAGPFRYIRNPLYLGNLFVAAAIGFFVPAIGWPIVVVAQWVFIRALIAEEEQGLLSRYGAAFEEYCAIVPRFIPRLRAALRQIAPHLGLLRGLECEPFVGSFVIAYALFAFGGYERVRWYIVGVLFIGIVTQYIMRSRIQRLKTSRSVAVRSTALSE